MIMRILYNNGKGSMNLILDEFFPTAKSRVQKLYKKFFLIGTAPASAYVDKCLQHLNERIPVQEEMAKDLANEYSKLKTEYEDMKRCITDKKKASGLPLRGDELAVLKGRLPQLNRDTQATKAAASKAVKDLKKLKENRQQLIELDGR